MKNFNPRSHEGSDNQEQSRSRKHDISIHAPTRGATTSGFKEVDVTQISIHAPTRGATRISWIVE